MNQPMLSLPIDRFYYGRHSSVTPMGKISEIGKPPTKPNLKFLEPTSVVLGRASAPIDYVRHPSYTLLVPIDYMQMLLDLMEERQKWLGQRDEAIREISRLSELIRATMNMIPPEQIARYEPVFERIEQRPPGLSLAIRACFTATQTTGLLNLKEASVPGMANLAGKEWLTPVDIRDALKNMGYPFENYKANPLASIHTTLKRMVPGELET